MEQQNQLQKMSYGIVNTSLAHLVGNVTSVVFDYFLSMYPKGFFKTTYIDTTMSSREFTKVKENFMDMHKSKPIIAIKPRVLPERPDFATTSFFNNSFGKNRYDMNRINSAVSTIYFDRDNDLVIDFSINRLKMNMEMLQIFETVMEQYNLFGFMNSKMQLEHDYRITKDLEVQLPKAMIEYIREAHDIPENSNRQLCEVLNKYSQYPVLYKLKTSTGNMEFFALIPTNIQLKIDTPSLSEGDKDGMVTSNFNISTNISLEFNYLDNFYIMSKHIKDFNKINIHNEELLKEAVIVPVQVTDTAMTIEQFTEDGWAFYISSDLLIDKVIDVDDTNIEGLFEPDDLVAIRNIGEQTAMSKPEVLKKYYRVKLYNKGVELEEGEDKDYQMLWDSMTLRNYNPDIMGYFVVVIYRNNIELNRFYEDNHAYSKK